MAYFLMMYEQQPGFRRGSNGKVIEDNWYVTPVKRGVDEVRREGQEDMSRCHTDVDFGTVGHATNSGVSEGQCMWICSSGIL